MYAIGVLGFFMRRFDFPVAPVILGVILGPLMEAQFRRTLLVSDGDFGAFLERPFAVVLFLLAIAALVVPATVGAVKRVRGLGGRRTRPASQHVVREERWAGARSPARAPAAPWQAPRTWAAARCVSNGEGLWGGGRPRLQSSGGLIPLRHSYPLLDAPRSKLPSLPGRR